MKKYLSYFISLCMIFTLQSNHAIAKYTKTYPAIWGYDLYDLPSMKSGEGSIKAYPQKDGDIWFLVNSSFKEENNTGEKYILIKFFKNEKREISEKERQALLKNQEAEDIKEIIFKDGSKLNLIINQNTQPYFIPDFCQNYFLLTNKKGLSKKYSLLLAPPQVDMFIDNLQKNDKYENTQHPPYFYQSLHLFNHLIPLKDDTFIVFDKKHNLIVRFDKKLNTQFKPVSPIYIQGIYVARNFFVIDYDVIENLIIKAKKTPEPTYQTVQNELLEYFHAKYPDKS